MRLAKYLIRFPVRMRCRLIIHGARPPVENMAVDEALLRVCEDGGKLFPVLRFYWWTVPTLSLGAKERIEKAADVEACRRLGVAIVRRPTGGRAVLHNEELTYSVVGPIGHPLFGNSVVKSYRKIAEAIRSGIKSIGVDLELTAGSRRGAGTHLPCFAAPSRYELAYGEQKVVGSAQRRLRKSVLQHGSILIKSGLDLLVEATGAGQKIKTVLAKSMIGIEEILGKSISRAELIEALLPPFSTILGAELEKADLTDAEQRLSTDLLSSGLFEVSESHA